MELSIKIEKSKLNQLQKRLKKLGTTIEQQAMIEVATVSLEIESEAKKRSPVDTGRLRASILTKPRGETLEKEIGSNVQYARDQEFGTIYQTGTPFLRPAFNKHKRTLLPRLKQRLKI